MRTRIWPPCAPNGLKPSPSCSRYVRGLSAADLDRILEFRNAKGTVFRDRIGHILQHLANHGSYHRGQVTTLLRQLGATPVSTDMIGFYRERAASAGAGREVAKHLALWS